MTRGTDKGDEKPPRRAQSGGRGVGGPPPGIPYGGRARSVYTPPTRRSEPEAPADSGATSPAGPAKKVPASRSRYGSVSPGKPLLAGDAPVFARDIVLHLQKPPYGDPDSDWPMYVSDETLPESAERSIVNGVYIHRSWLPNPPPEKLRVRFGPA